MKVFDHIDFNNFFEDKSKLDFRLPRIEQSLCFEDIFFESLLNEMAQGTQPGSGTRAAIRLDDEDIMYLYQFLPSDWSKALWWRYGPGLINYARHRHGNVLKHEDDNPDSNYHGHDESGGLFNEDPEDAIEFDEKTLLGSTGERERKMPKKFGGPEGKPKLDWMRPEDNYDQKKHNMGNVQSSTRRRYSKIKFGWNKLYHKLNLDYRFGMHGVDDRHWHGEGQLPNLAGYKPMNWKGLNNDMNGYFKAIGMKHHHPEDYNDQLNAYQQSVQHLGKDVKSTTNDQANIHDINPITKGSHNDGMWANAKPGARIGTHGLQNTTSVGPNGETIQNHEYTDHLYSLMNKGIGGGKNYSRNGEESAVQPFYLGSPKPGANTSYNIYEVFGLHKALKKQEWELERYFPHEFHEIAYQELKNIADGTKIKQMSKAEATEDPDGDERRREWAKRASGIARKDVDDQNKLMTLLTQLEAPGVKYRWQPIPREQVDPKNPNIQHDGNGNYFTKVEDEFVREGIDSLKSGGMLRLPKWQYLFLSRYANRFNPAKPEGLTHNQNLAMTSVYKTITHSRINEVLDGHQELTFLQNSLAQKRGHQKDSDVRRRQIEQKYGVKNKKRHSTTEVSKKTGKGSSSIAFNKTFKKDLEDDRNEKTRIPKDKITAHAKHTDVMVGGVWHAFGGADSNIEERNAKDGKWHPFPEQKIFVPLLHRGQVLSSEKQVSKGINVGAFGHSQVAEVEVNHFGVDPSDDKFSVSGETAKKYPQVKSQQDPENPDRYFVNRNEYFWACAENGDIPSKEFFSGHKEKWDGHVNAIRNTDHHHEHMSNQHVDEDRLYKYNYEGFCGDEDAGGEAILKSVKCGVCDALNKIKKKDNGEALVQEMQNRLNTLWGYGMDLLKANVSHPQFFQNSEYKSHLEKEYEDMPRHPNGSVDVEGVRKSGLNFEGTPATGYVWRKMRVANYIGSYSQRGFSENVPFRRERVGKTEGGTRQAEDYDFNKVNRDYKHSRGQEEVAGRTERGQTKFQQKETGERASAQNSWLRRTENYLDVKKSKNAFEIKSVNEINETEDSVRLAHLATLALWAIESHKVPTVREIAQNPKHGGGREQDPAEVPAGISSPVSKEEAMSSNFTGKPEYNEAHGEQLKLAMEWAQARSKKEFDERLKKSDKEWYNGPTESIEDGGFIAKLIDKDPIAELMSRAYEYDKKAQFSLTGADFDDFQPEQTKHHRMLHKHVEEIFPDGLFDTSNMGENFTNKLETLSNIFEKKEGIPFAKISSDYFINGVNPKSLDNNNDELVKGVTTNATEFERILRESPIQEIQQLGNEFKANFNSKLDMDKNLNRYISSSIGKDHESGRRAAMADYDKAIKKIQEKQETPSSVKKLEGIQKEKHAYSSSYTALSAWFHHSHFELKTVVDLARKTKESAAEKDALPFIWQVFEDAFIDQMVDYLSHSQHYSDHYDDVIESAKGLISFFKDEKILDSFRNNVKGELEEIDARHKTTDEEAA